MIRYCDHFEQYGIDFFNKAAENNLEGIIAKRAESGYTTGVRTKEWLKIKHQLNREAIIVGYTEPRNSRKYFGALILAEYEGKNLKYLGHTGTGFNTKTLKDVWDKMQPLKTGSSPFRERIKVNAPVTWIKPKLVCQLHFTKVTEEEIEKIEIMVNEKIRENIALMEQRNVPIAKAMADKSILVTLR